MLISNSIGKSKADPPAMTSSSNIFMRSDGFKKVIKGFSANKIKASDESTYIKIHTSSGFRRLTK
jgi:hypothetical protein